MELHKACWQVSRDRVERIWRREGLKVPQKQKPRGSLWLNSGKRISAFWLDDRRTGDLAFCRWARAEGQPQIFRLLSPRRPPLKMTNVYYGLGLVVSHPNRKNKGEGRAPGAGESAVFSPTQAKPGWGIRDITCPAEKRSAGLETGAALQESSNK